MRRSADSDHRLQGSSVHEHAAQRNENIRSSKHIIRLKNTVQYIGQRDPGGKSFSRNSILCLIFLHRFYIPVGKTLQSAAIMKNVEMRKKEIKHIKKRK